MLIRPAWASDAPAIADIYGWYAANTAITFAEEGPTAADFALRIADTRYPFFVAEEDGAVCGFIYAAAFRQKDAYRWDVELTIYLAPGLEGHGTGSLLMDACLQALTRQGYLNAYSCITLPNEPSLCLHRHFGFTQVGLFENAGYKLGKWRSVTWLRLPLGDFNGEPAEPVSISQLSENQIMHILDC